VILNPSQEVPQYLDWAGKYATRSEHGIYKVGAVIVYKGKFLAGGWNKNKTHPRAKNYTTKIHAELAALIAHRHESLIFADMYVARRTNGGALATSKPCRDCMVLIREAGLKSVTFISENGIIITERL
jgi:deoxycytidylate deaminase